MHDHLPQQISQDCLQIIILLIGDHSIIINYSDTIHWQIIGVSTSTVISDYKMFLAVFINVS